MIVLLSACGSSVPSVPAVPQPGTLTMTEPYSSFDLQRQGGWLYWWDRTPPSSVKRLEISSGTTEVVAVIPGLRNFVVDDDLLVASSHTTGLWWLEPSSSLPPQRVDLPSEGTPLLLDGGSVYYCLGSHIGRWAPGQAAQPLVSVGRFSSPPEGSSGSRCDVVDFFRDGFGPLYALHGRVYRLNPTPSSAVSTPSNPLSPQPHKVVGIDSTHIYLEYIDLFRMPRTDGPAATPTKFMARGPGSLLDLELDDTHVYWVEPGVTDGTSGSWLVKPGVVRTPKTGGDPQRVLDLQAPSSITVDGADLCWLDRAGSIGCRAKSSLE